MEEAVKMAEYYIEQYALSKLELLDQLRTDGFTNKEAKYGATVLDPYH